MAKERSKRTTSTRDRKLQQAERRAHLRADTRPVGSAQDQGYMLPHSPATTWHGVTSEGQDAEARDLIEQWPFRLVRTGTRVGHDDGWTCLRLLAHDLDCSVAETVAHLRLLEENALHYWHPDTSAYVVPNDVLTAGPEAGQADIVRELRSLLNQRASEPAATRASRAWARVTVDRTDT